MTDNNDNETTAPAAEKATGKSTKKTTKKKAKKKTKKTKKKTKKTKKKALSKKERAERAEQKEKQAAAVQAIADALHAIIKEAAPRLTPTMMWGHQFYAGTAPVVGVALHDDHVNLVVYNGDEVQDPEGLMRGVGYNRSVRVDRLDGIPKSALAEIIRTSASADAAKKADESGT